MTAELLTDQRVDWRDGFGVFVIVAFLLGIAFFLAGHNVDFTISTGPDLTKTGADSASAVEEGSALRKVVFLGLGALGGYLLLRVMGRPFSFSDPLGMIAVAYLVYCLASVAWSDSPSLTFRRSVVLACCAVAVFGCARQMRRDQLVWTAMLCSGAFVVIGLGAEIALGTFRPWASGYRFAGTLHPNGQGQLCALWCVSSYALFRESRRGRLFLFLTMAAACGLLILTRSRTSALGFLAAMALLWIPFARGQRVAFAAVGAPLMICLGGFVAVIVGVDLGAGVSNAVTLGRNEQLGSLTGRIPLWQELIPEAMNRPVFGSGYMSFWTADRIEDVSSQLQWTIPDAHNEYLDTLLNLGLIGFSLLALLVVGSFLRGFHAYLRTGDACYGFFAAHIFGSAVGAMFESGFAQPLGFTTFISACGVAYLACQAPAEAARRFRRATISAEGAMPARAF